MMPTDLLNCWVESANRANADALSGLYDPNATLIPTFSNRVLSQPADIRTYFEQLCSRERLHVTLHERTVRVQMHGEAFCSIYGLYCWRFAVEGELLAFEARFSFLVSLTANHPILHHHSSQIPRML